MNSQINGLIGLLKINAIFIFYFFSDNHYYLLMQMLLDKSEDCISFVITINEEDRNYGLSNTSV